MRENVVRGLNPRVEWPGKEILRKWLLSKNWKKRKLMILKAKQVKRPWGRSMLNVPGTARKTVWVATVQKMRGKIL